MGLWDSLRGFVGYGGNAFADTISSIDRANQRFLVPQDSRLYLSRWTRRELNNKSEWVWQNFGIVKEGVSGVARHTVGKGMSLQLDSEDSEWNELAEQDFEAYALSPDRCDLSGRRNFYEAQTTAIEQRMIRGEFFAALTENPEWSNEPCFQIYDSEEIVQPIGADYSSRRIIDGVELDKNSRAIRYFLRAEDGNPAGHPVDRAFIRHWYKPHAINQVRGITEFAQAVNPLVDIHELIRLATRCAKAQQLLALVLKGSVKAKGKGPFGAIESAARKTDGTPDPDSLNLEKIVGAAGGGIWHAPADQNVGAELITSNSPSPLLKPFISDLLMRNVFATIGLPSEFFWDPSALSGANTRFILARADLFFQIFGDRLIDNFCNPVGFRYLSHRMQSGKLRACKDPNWAMRMSWQQPERVTVDNGRDGKLLIELLANGMITLREYCNKRGLNYRNEMRQWIREPIEFIRMAEEEGAPPEMLAMWKQNPPMWRASKPGAVQANGADPNGQQNGDSGGTDGSNASQQVFNISVNGKPPGGTRSFVIDRGNGTTVRGDITESEPNP